MSVCSIKTEEETLKPNVKVIPLIISVIVGIAICFMPRPTQIPQEGWYLLAVFMSIIVACAIGAASVGLAAFIGIFVLTFTHIITVKTAFSSYSESLIWLIVCADCLSMGITNTGLGKRIAYNIIKLIGRRTIGAGYALVLCEIILGAFVPSATSRSAGIVLPIARSLAEGYGSKAEDGTQQRAGEFLLLTALHSNFISSSFFMTASAVNFLAITMAKGLGVDAEISLQSWFLVGVGPCVVGFILIPLIIYFICPPEIKEVHNVKDIMDEKLGELGKIKKSEKIMIVLFVTVLLLWMFGSMLNIDSTTVAVLGLVVAISTGIVSWKQFTGKKEIWDLLIWQGSFMMMSSQLNKLGVVDWISGGVKKNISGVPWWAALFIVAVAMYYLHYLFASNTVHFTALFSAFLAILISVGVPPIISIVLLTNMSALSSGLTHYAVAHGSVFFATGYIDQKKWWKVGFIVSIAHIIIWYGIGMLWWKLMGVY
ncbi:DASS family sodium-coupled anion symporter [Clostridium sp. BL-8]|uniref:DASS family sodium-coupled anion symporter n=1 Tax=Clostridium sp. BL-8 TaxID=349938 RepID=UPI00098C7DE9|nr:DASS family sodium-coupled anion symporter [Clostridium sp. BL-8]OOM80835.1 putative malate transporter YflS [Clostridium sp. BL-8]